MEKMIQILIDSKILRCLLIYALGFFCIGIGALAMKPQMPADIATQNIHNELTKVDMAPIRGELRPLRLRRTGFEYKCSECHRTFDTSQQQEKRISEHKDLILDHGRNDYCLNCHHKTNRDVYTDYDGSEIPADQPARLCAKCHGPTYRDWIIGAHGKITGSWDSSNLLAERLLCIQCHDPHAPSFPALRPMPGPKKGRIQEWREEA